MFKKKKKIHLNNTVVLTYMFSFRWTEIPIDFTTTQPRTKCMHDYNIFYFQTIKDMKTKSSAPSLGFGIKFNIHQILKVITNNIICIYFRVTNNIVWICVVLNLRSNYHENISKFKKTLYVLQTKIKNISKYFLYHKCDIFDSVRDF